MPKQQKVILESPLTCMSAFIAPPKRETTTSKQYETKGLDSLENKLLKDLISLGYQKIAPKNEQELKANLKICLERLNNITLSEKEFKRLLNDELNGKDYIEKTRQVQENFEFIFELDNKEQKTLKLFDKFDLNKNCLQVMHQYKSKTNRYDVQILINGLPLVHIELKQRGVRVKEAIEQLERYKEEGLKGNLFEFIQMFVVSNGTTSYYYPNSAFFREKEQGSSATIESVFKIHWASKDNKAWLDLEDFSQSFLHPTTLLEMLFFYSVFNVKNELLIMRPYQVGACEEILQNIYKNLDHKERCKSRGYIWHSTGSGKTLTSFKTAILLKNFEKIEKILFVVDRKDLDYQSMQEYNKFQKGCVEGTKNSADLKEKLESAEEKDKIIITTIQKLSHMIKKDKGTESYYTKEVVFIFDECHRSQFGTMHKSIISSFRKYHLYGFTGTPIFSQSQKESLLNGIEVRENDNLGNYGNYTDLVFNQCLHRYTIVDAIRNGTVLKFMIDYYKDNEKLDKLESLNPKRIDTITKEIITQFNTKTKEREFNSILATENIQMAKSYYECFKNNAHDLKIALIYSASAKGDEEEENNEEVTGLELNDKEFLSRAIKDYNKSFGTGYRIDDNFAEYYKDISSRMKDKEIDLLIVVNMFLTGFDAPRLNTLWVDKNLKEHGLIQAFSRTNRIYNPKKAHGNIVSFRNLENNLNDALRLYGLANSKEVVMTNYKQSLEVYLECAKSLKQDFSLNSLQYLENKEQKRAFMKAFNQLLKLDNALRYFTQFEKDKQISDRELQDYGSYYYDFKDELKDNSNDNNNESDTPTDNRDNPTSLDNNQSEQDYVLEFLKAIEVGVKYILELYEKNTPKLEIDKCIKMTPSAREIKDLLEEFFKCYEKNKPSDIIQAFRDFIIEKKEKDLEQLIKKYDLKDKETKDFIMQAFNNHAISFVGTKFGAIFKIDYFNKDYARIKREVKNALEEYFEFYTKDFLK
ncbi:type I restriction endonuclease subunit R [Helicobacter cetorum]|uniref:type I restriction endonuclease subunit R n=1 Tax=Helicobacter cetorum TaxID=138563 RepID=UPI000CF05B83|nr:type I restriction endonuclease subunit R [Helicobacter cetorum]